MYVMKVGQVKSKQTNISMWKQINLKYKSGSCKKTPLEKNSNYIALNWARDKRKWTEDFNPSQSLKGSNSLDQHTWNVYRCCLHSKNKLSTVTLYLKIHNNRGIDYEIKGLVWTFKNHTIENMGTQWACSITVPRYDQH